LGPPVQAISEVAELMNSMAVMKAAAKAVALWRLAEKVAVIVWSLFVVAAHHWATDLSMLGPCQFEFIE
jgi:hypothetical protein